MEPCDRCAGIFFALLLDQKIVFKLFFLQVLQLQQAVAGSIAIITLHSPIKRIFGKFTSLIGILPVRLLISNIFDLELIESSGLLNYWGVQVPFVSFFEAGDPTCGDRVCGGNDFLGRPETCATCPTDCGACPTGVCGNGRCEFGESWAPRVC